MEENRFKKTRHVSEFESPKEIRERLGLANPHSLTVFKAAIIAMRDAQMVEEEFSLDKAMNMFDSLMALEMLDRQCLVDYDYVIIERSRMFDPAIRTQIQTYRGTDNQLIFQVATISEDDSDFTEVVCEYQVNLLDLDGEDISPYLRNMYEIFMLN